MGTEIGCNLEYADGSFLGSNELCICLMSLFLSCGNPYGLIRLSCYGHVVMRRDDMHVTKSVMGMNVDGWRGRRRPKKRWMDCVTNDMLEKGVDDARTSYRGEWKKITYCADPK